MDEKEMTSLTIRTELEQAEKFKDICKDESLAQGEVFKNLIQLYFGNKAVFPEKIAIPTGNEISLLVKKQVFLPDTPKIEKATRRFVINGELIYWIPQPRSFYDWSKKSLIDELNTREPIFDDTKYMSYYQFAVYRRLDQKFVVYQVINIVAKDTSIVRANIKIAKVADTLEQIIYYIRTYASVPEIEGVETCLAEKIDDSELLNY